MRGSPIAVKYRVLVTKIPFIAVVGYARPCFRFKETVLRNERVSKCCKIQDFVPKIPLTTVAGYARPCFGRKETVIQTEEGLQRLSNTVFWNKPVEVKAEIPPRRRDLFERRSSREDNAI